MLPLTLAGAVLGSLNPTSLLTLAGAVLGSLNPTSLLTLAGAVLGSLNPTSLLTLAGAVLGEPNLTTWYSWHHAAVARVLGRDSPAGRIRLPLLRYVPPCMCLPRPAARDLLHTSNLKLYFVPQGSRYAVGFPLPCSSGCCTRAR